MSDIIGRRVSVTVDRPLGSTHPNHPDLIYPINYGYIESLIAPDGEEQDVYILGIDKPIEKFEGIVVAVIHRFDDIEEKWVVAPENVHFSKDEISEAVEFQERFFKTEIIMT